MMSLPDFSYKQAIFYFSTHDKSKLCFRADNLIIKDETGKIILQHSCYRTFALFIIGGFSLTHAIIQKAKQFGFPIILMSYNLRPYAYFNNRAEGNFLLRRKQYNNSGKDLLIARKIVQQKIGNQLKLLQSLRYRSKQVNEMIERITAVSLDSVADDQELRGKEGTVSKIFFPTYFNNMNWIRREPRTKRDIPNLLLDIGYTYIFYFVEALTEIYGFDPFCGVYHKFFYQRKSLICDLVEPFRCIIDQRLRKAYNLNQIDENDFFVKNGQYVLNYKKQSKYTKLFMKDILSYKSEIFLWIQQYYRWFMKDKHITQFPKFEI